MSSLEAISGFKLEIDIVQNIIKVYIRLADSGKIIILCICTQMAIDRSPFETATTTVIVAAVVTGSGHTLLCCNLLGLLLQILQRKQGTSHTMQAIADVAYFNSGLRKLNVNCLACAVALYS